MNANKINLWAVQTGTTEKDYKTLVGAKKAYGEAKKEDYARLIQYTDVVGCVEELEEKC